MTALDELIGATSAPLATALVEMIRAELGADPALRAGALERLTRLIGQTLVLADLMGRAEILADADRAEARAFSDDVAALVPDVEFGEAIADVVTREPRLARTADEVARLYRERHAYALARSTDILVTQRVREEVSRIARSGGGTATAEVVIAALGDWSRAYAETVYRTNLATAYSAGRFRQALDPQVSRVMSAFEVETAGDADVRDGVNDPENHAAADGLIAATNDPVWSSATPPYGYNCRCSLRLVSKYELEERGLLRPDGTVIRQEPPGFRAFKPHPRFGHVRPDVALYG